ncbi:MAG: cohesin domain-containing protein, partial [candidate division KSB1 bacterium]|nr:cohesin domain-containing protein [candidate division KSB1 bacterium]
MFTRQNIIILILSICLEFCYSNVKSEIIFFDSFEYYETNQYPIGGWWRTLYNGTSARISTDYAFDLGTKSFRLEGYSNWSRIDGFNINYDNQITYQACVYILDTQKGAIVGFFESQGNMAPSYNAVFFRNDGKICIHDNGQSDIELRSYNSGQWYVVTASIDFTNNSMDVYIDGANVFSAHPRSTKDHCQIFALATNNFSTTGTAVCYFDNVIILNNSIQTSSIVSTIGDIWAFAYDWWWSKERNRDGRYAETKLVVPAFISDQHRASLSVWNWYSQASGSAHCRVYLSTQQQVTPTDNKHNLITWWVGNQASLGTLVGEYDAVNTRAQKNFDISDFITTNKSEEYYVAIENQGYADVAAGGIYICVKYSPLYITTVVNNHSLHQEFYVDIQVKDAQNLFGVAFKFNFPADKLEALAAEKGDFLGADPVFFPDINNSVGVVSVGISKKSGQPAANGTGIVARIKLKEKPSVTSGITIDLSLTEVAAMDPSGNPITLTPQNTSYLTPSASATLEVSPTSLTLASAANS